MFLRNGAVTPGPSRECDITFFVQGRPKSARQLHDSTVAACRMQSVTVPSSRVSRECRSPGLRSPPFKNARLKPVKLRRSVGFSKSANRTQYRENAGKWSQEIPQSEKHRKCGKLWIPKCRPLRKLPPTWVIHTATHRPAHNTPIHMDLVDRRRVVGWSAGRHVDHPCGWQLSPMSS